MSSADTGKVTGLGHAIENCKGFYVQNELRGIQTWLDNGADPNEHHRNRLPLVWCINGSIYTHSEEIKLKIAKMLIDAGAYASGDYPESSPLYHAVIGGHISIIKLLVENGADFLLHDALITAVEKRSIKIVDELIKLGADVNSPNSKFELPLLCATQLMNGPMIKHLLEKGADPNKTNVNNESALSISLAKNDLGTFKVLIEAGADPKLASQEIEDKMITNPRLADYMKNIQKTRSEKSLSGQLAGLELAKIQKKPKLAAYIMNEQKRDLKISRTGDFCGHEAAPKQ